MGKKAHSHYISTGSWKSWGLSLLSVAYFTRGTLSAGDIAWSWMDKRNSRGTCWCSALPFSINITLLNREIITEAFKEQRHQLATSSADKTASLEPFRFAFSPPFTQGYRSFKWSCMKMPAKQPCLSLLKIWSKKSLFLCSGLCPFNMEKCEDPFRHKNPILQCCKNDMKSIQAFFYKQASIMHILKQLNNCIK